MGEKNPPAGRVDQTTIDSLGLEVGRSFGYWFDFGDDWWHQINVEAIEDKVPEGQVPQGDEAGRQEPAAVCRGGRVAGKPATAGFPSHWTGRYRDNEGRRTVRFPEAKIKEAILHPDPEIRDRATSYFAKSYSPDPSIMPLVIKAVETYGRQDAYRLIGPSRDLPQTAETIAWVIDELNDEQSDQYENYTYNLSMVLVKADPALLLPRESAILEARHFLPDLRAAFTERLRMLSWDAATCWRELEEFCEEGKDKQYANEVDLGHAHRIVEALARYGKECEEKVHALLGQKVEDYRQSPMKWMEPLVVRLAGQAHLESTIPLIITKLSEDGGDILNEECAEALTRIGTPAVLHAVAEAFPDAELALPALCHRAAGEHPLRPRRGDRPATAGAGAG